MRKKETTKYRKNKAFKIVGWFLLIIGILGIVTFITLFINWEKRKDNYTLEYVYSESGTLYYEVNKEKVYIQNIYNTHNEKIKLNIPNRATVMLYIDKTNITDGIYFDLDNSFDRGILNPISLIFVILFFISSGLTSILTYEEINGKKYKLPAVFPIFIFLIILGIGFISSQVSQAIDYFSLKEKNNVTVATIYSDIYIKGRASNSYKAVSYYFVEGNKYLYVNNYFEKGTLNDKLGDTFELYYDEQNPNKSIKKGEPVNVILLVVGIGLVILFSAPVVILLRNTSKKLKNDFDYKNSY